MMLVSVLVDDVRYDTKIALGHTIIQSLDEDEPGESPPFGGPLGLRCIR
jgi:hypothetical protein